MINVLIADDHVHVRSYIRKLLGRAEGINVIAEAQDGSEALDLLDQTAADVLLLDIEMPKMNGIEVLSHLQKKQCTTPVLILSGYIDKELIYGAINLGARGYILKEDAPDCLVKAITQMSKNDPVFLSHSAKSALYS